MKKGKKMQDARFRMHDNYKSLTFLTLHPEAGLREGSLRHVSCIMHQLSLTMEGLWLF